MTNSIMNVDPNAIYREDMDGATFEVVLDYVGKSQQIDNTLFLPPIEQKCVCGQNHSEGYRVGEYATAMFSPSINEEDLKKEGLSAAIVSTIEHVRVITRARQADIPTPDEICPLTVSTHLARSIQAAPIDELILETINAHTVKSFSRDQLPTQFEINPLIQDDQLIDLLAKRQNKRNSTTEHVATIMNQEIIEGFNGDHTGDTTVPIFANTLSAARRITEIAKEAMREDQKLAKAIEARLQGLSAEGKSPMTAPPSDSDEDEDEGEDAYDGLIGRGDIEKAEKEARNEKRFFVPPPAVGTDGQQVWGDMEIHQPMRSRKAIATPIRKHTSRDEGVIPTAIHRWCTDKRIFQQKAHRKGSISVLIDDSGSMRWNERQLQSFLDQLPGSAIAVYAGGYETGILRILAYKGFRVEKEHMTKIGLGGNTIDGPALRWLAKQPGPRIWVSDGQVFGRHSTMNSSSNNRKAIIEDANMIMRRANITRVPDMESAARLIEGNYPWGYHPCRG